MEGVPQFFDDPRDAARYRRPAHLPGVECYRAHIVRHAFEPHSHDGFGLGAIETGAERFRYRGAEHLASSGALLLMNPGELHTGRAETDGGWRYRMLYVDPDLAERVTGERGWHFRDAVRQNPAAARRATALLDALWAARESLAFDSLLAELLALFRPHATVGRGAHGGAAPRFGPVLDYLHARIAERLTLDDLATVAGLSPWHFLRSFRAQYHVSPQQMLMALRLAEAKRLLAAGVRPAQVAAAAGLADQAHLTRAFACRYGVTPARYQRQLRA
ncbi:AraC family transcriptional regulator [Pseudothauera rhizosphaerae]|uniref:AraC family transcriptional regulator n=1 Tax=Pseudothauera rhizosphaerae TaxID=2565932 RepID=A0A4S4AL28_9RHOO|nr:AraC family transcriptional regulator [Pseudothauera rhizosphaerae]THF60186.1 AraC family transcriptional regulator [Pseudothauera rhizosphaerae]